MVATRSGGKKAPEADTTTKNLKAPPKRAVKRKAAGDAPTAPARKTRKTEKDDEVLATQGAISAPTRKVTRTTKATSKTTAAKPTRRTAKTSASLPENEAETQDAVEKTQVEVLPEEKPKAAEKATRTRGTVKKVEPAPKVMRGRRTAAVEASIAVSEDKENEDFEATAVVEKQIQEQPAARTRRLAAKEPLKNSILAAPALKPTRGSTRSTRGVVPAAVPAVAESPLKAPAQKPIRQVKSAKSRAAPRHLEEAPKHADPSPQKTPANPFKDLPSYPATPAHILAPVSSRVALAELPNWPNTPANFLSAHANRRAFGTLPEEYPKTPKHAAGVLSNLHNLAALPEEYPKTPAYAAATVSNIENFGQLPEEYPQTPAIVQANLENQDASERSSSEHTQVSSATASEANLVELDALPQGYPTTPADATAIVNNLHAMKALPEEYPNTPAFANATVSNLAALGSLPEEYPKTPAFATAVTANLAAFGQLPGEYPKTPKQLLSAYKNRTALDALPEQYPKTPSHIIAPMTNAAALAELTSYAQTPRDVESAVQAAIQSAMSSPLDQAAAQAAVNATPVEFDMDVVPAAQLEQENNAEESSVSEISVSQSTVPALSFPMPTGSLKLSVPAQPSTSPTKRSALRSPVKHRADLAKTPKKTVTWNDDSEEDFLLFDGPLHGMTFFVDVTSNGKDQSFLFTSLLEDMGAQVIREWNENTTLTHVLFKDGQVSTLQRVLASHGKVKCVNVGWALESEKLKKRMDESPYLVDLAPARALSPLAPKRAPFTPAKTPSRFVFSMQDKKSTSTPGGNSLPATPTSSEFDRSLNFDDKENSEIGIYFQQGEDAGIAAAAKTCPRPKSSWLLNKSPMKTPSKPSVLLGHTPLRPFSTSKKFNGGTRSFGVAGTGMGPARRLKLF